MYKSSKNLQVSTEKKKKKKIMSCKCDTYGPEQTTDHEQRSRLLGGSKYSGSKDSDPVYNPSGDRESPK